MRKKSVNTIKTDNAREIALKTLYDINEKGGYTNLVLDKALSSSGIKELDRAFITELVYGITRRRFTIDYIIRKNSSVRLKKISPWIINILRLGVYQLIYTTKIPESAACNESVQLAKKYGHASSTNFVNGVLRSIGRKKNNITYPKKEENVIDYLSVKYSFPKWIVKLLMDRFDLEFCESFLESSNEIPSITIRNNSLKTSKENLVNELTKNEYNHDEGNHLSEAILLKNTSDITKISGFKEGLFQVQDQSSMLASIILDPKPNERVLDVCAAPGGKSAHIAQIMNNKGEVLARDVHTHKILLMNDMFKRLGIDIIKTGVYNATKIDDTLINKMDRVIVDAPCSGFGIIKKKPDIKIKRTKEDITELSMLQKNILKVSSKYVKKGGRLVYSTCTITKEENTDILFEFLEENKDFVLEDISNLVPTTLNKESCKKGYIEIFPNIDKMDGFFIASMKKV